LLSSSKIDSLIWSEFKLVFETEKDLFLPEYKGSAIRGGFGHALRKVSCTNRNTECKNCILKQRCVYSYIFETPPAEDSKMMKKYPSAPHPFIIEPPLDNKRNYTEGENLTVKLTLIGKGIEYLPYFVYAFDEMGKSGLGRDRKKLYLKYVENLSTEEEQKEVIFESAKKILRSPCFISKPADFKKNFNNHEITLKFLTPARIKYNERFGESLEFYMLIPSLLRRISSISYFHCGQDLEADYKSLAEKAKEIKKTSDRLRWYDWERYSNRQKTSMNLGGFTGEVTFEGNLEEFMPWLLLGEKWHVGKGASFGLGKYEIL